MNAILIYALVGIISAIVALCAYILIRKIVLKGQKEEIIRKAADMLNKMIGQYQEKFPNKGMTEILSFMALNVCMNNILLQKQLKGMKDAEDALASELERYLEDIEKTSR